MNQKVTLSILGLLFCANTAAMNTLESEINKRNLSGVKKLIDAGTEVTDVDLELAKKKAEDKQPLTKWEYPDSKSIAEYLKKGRLRTLLEIMMDDIGRYESVTTSVQRATALTNIQTGFGEIKKLKNDLVDKKVDFRSQPFESSKKIQDSIATITSLDLDKDKKMSQIEEDLAPILLFFIEEKVPAYKVGNEFDSLKNAIVKKNIKFITVLVGKDGNFESIKDSKDEFGNNLIHFTLKHFLDENVDEILQLLIKAGVDPIAPDKSGETPIYIAIKNENSGALEVLLKAGVSLDQKAKELGTNSKNESIANIIHKESKKEEIKARDEQLEQQKKQIEAYNEIKKIVDALAKSSDTVENINTALKNLAAYHAKYGTFVNLDTFAAGFNAILLNILKRDQSKLDPNIVDEIVKQLIELRADLHVREIGKNALHFLVTNKQIELLKFVLETAHKKMTKQNEGFFLNHKDELGNTPLHIAAAGYYEGGLLGFGGKLNEALTKEVIDRLLKAGAKIDIKNKKQLKPAEVATEPKIAEMIDPQIRLDREKTEKEAKEKKEREAKEALIKKEYAEQEKQMKLFEEERIRKEKEQAEKQKREQEIIKKQQEEEKKRLELLAKTDKELAERLQKEEDEKKRKEEEELLKVVELQLKKELELAEKARKAVEAGEAIDLFTVKLEQLKLSLQELASQITIYKLSK
jgi:ankyrin repeat protein